LTGGAGDNFILRDGDRKGIKFDGSRSFAQIIQIYRLIKVLVPTKRVQKNKIASFLFGSNGYSFVEGIVEQDKNPMCVCLCV